MDSVHFFNIVKIHARRAVVAKSTNDSKCVQACSLAALVGSLGRAAAVDRKNRMAETPGSLIQ